MHLPPFIKLAADLLAPPAGQELYREFFAGRRNPGNQSTFRIRLFLFEAVEDEDMTPDDFEDDTVYGCVQLTAPAPASSLANQLPAQAAVRGAGGSCWDRAGGPQQLRQQPQQLKLPCELIGC